METVSISTDRSPQMLHTVGEIFPVTTDSQLSPFMDSHKLSWHICMVSWFNIIVFTEEAKKMLVTEKDIA